MKKLSRLWRRLVSFFTREWITLGNFSYGIVINDGYPARVKVSNIVFSRRTKKLSFTYDVVDMHNKSIPINEDQRGILLGDIMEAIFEIHTKETRVP